MPVCVTVLDVRRKRHSVAGGQWRAEGMGMGGAVGAACSADDLRPSPLQADLGSVGGENSAAALQGMTMLQKFCAHINLR